MSMTCLTRALSMWAKPCAGNDGHHSAAVLAVHTDTPASCCHCGAKALVTLHKSYHIVIFPPFLPECQENVSPSEGDVLGLALHSLATHTGSPSDAAVAPLHFPLLIRVL